MKLSLFGGSGLVGSGILRNLQNYSEIDAPTHKSLDLTNYNDVESYISHFKPKVIIMAAGKVGGIKYNVDNHLNLFHENLSMNLNLLKAAYIHNINKFCLISSSCIYPKQAPRPYKEENIFDGLPEDTNEGYALAKSTAVRYLSLCRKLGMRNWFVAIPTNIYGIEDNFSESGHLIGSVIFKIISGQRQNSEKITFLGNGQSKRQFLFNDDLGKCINHLLERDQTPEFINVSNNETVSVREIIEKISNLIGFTGKIEFDGNLDFVGNIDKSMSIERLRNLDWRAITNLDTGLNQIINSQKFSSI